MEPTKFYKYTIPADAIILENFNETHHNRKHWRDPDTFGIEWWFNSDEESKHHKCYIRIFRIGEPLSMRLYNFKTAKTKNIDNLPN